MNKVLSLLLVLSFIFVSCQSEKKAEKEKIVIGTKEKETKPFELGEQLFKGKGNCYSCHRINKKSIGPSVTTIMKVYKEQDGDIISFLKQKSEPIVDPENYAVMKTNFARLKKMSDEELASLELYMKEVSVAQ
ncbi:hypothetical protein GCM10022393_07470 [Aquimarina addita]|uniref:Cytochrome c domain-containing protein n=1 Tax=Aquimarina addita TaxID=870485 RepID=A0ABP7XC28_9FLAO